MKSSEDKSLGSEIKEGKETEELSLNIEKLKKNMTYIIKILQGRLDKIPEESVAEEEEHITEERQFIADTMEKASFVSTLLVEPSDGLNSIDLNRFTKILDEHKDIFTDILVGGRFLSEEDKNLVSAAAFTIITSNNSKAVLPAIDQLVEVHYTTFLARNFFRILQEKNFSDLNSLKEHVKDHYAVGNQEAAEKLKKVFNRLFFSEEYKELREKFYTVIDDPAIKENIIALQASCEFEEEEKDRESCEIAEDEEYEEDEDKLMPKQKDFENFIAFTEMSIKLDEKDDGYEIESKSLLEEQSNLGTYKIEREKFKNYLSKLKDETIEKKASDILAAVENAKINSITSDEMLADTLFLTNQFLEKITSGKGEKISERMCLDYKALAENLNKTPLSKKIAGAMIAFLGATVLVFQLPFMRYNMGFNLLSKGIVKHKGTKSIAENSIDFLEEVRPKKQQGRV